MWIVCDWQFQQRKRNVTNQSIRKYWLSEYIEAKLTSPIDNVWLSVIHSFSKKTQFDKSMQQTLLNEKPISTSFIANLLAVLTRELWVIHSLSRENAGRPMNQLTSYWCKDALALNLPTVMMCELCVIRRFSMHNAALQIIQAKCYWIKIQHELYNSKLTYCIDDV